MKANRKFLNGDDEAVSPVIAVILMVAITVVLAATVYVWVSGFGSQSGSPAKSVAFSSNGPLGNGGWKNYTIASATSGMKYGDIKVTIDGSEFALDTATDCTTTPVTIASSKYGACAGNGATSDQAATDTVDAGEIIHLKGLTSGQTLRVLDATANSVILTLTVG